MSSSLALISHDLKNSLGALEAQLEGMIDEPTPVAAQHAHMQCADLRRQFIQFLTLYTAESAGLRALSEDESPKELLAAMHRNWRLKLQTEGRPIDIRIKPQDTAPEFWYFDRRLVQLALDAAIHNAQRFARTWIELSVREQENCLVWQIRDDGPGLGCEDPGSEHATGLGTALAQAVAQAHQLGERVGKVNLTSSPTGGTEFELWLP